MLDLVILQFETIAGYKCDICVGGNVFDIIYPSSIYNFRVWSGKIVEYSKSNNNNYVKLC